METMKLQKKVTASAMLDPKIVVPAIRAAFAKLDPRLMIKNPVMFVVEIVAALTTVIFLRNLATGGEGLVPRGRSTRSPAGTQRAAPRPATARMTRLAPGAWSIGEQSHG